MNDAAVELLARGVHALRRSTIWWGSGVVFFVVLNAAFWPSLEGSKALQGFEDMGDLLDAFGAGNLASAAGYLDGQVFALMLPLLLSGMAVAGCSGITSGDEDAGRLELLHALPVGRRAVWLSRWAASLLALIAVTAVVAAVATVSLPVFSFDGVRAASVVAATGGCGLLAAFHAAAAFAAGGLGASRGRAVGVAVLVLVAGYMMNFLLPLADAVAGARQWSPWYWAIGEQPVSNGLHADRLLLLAALTAALVWAGAAAVERRDIRST